MSDRQQFHSLNLPYLAAFFDRMLAMDPLDPQVVELLLGRPLSEIVPPSSVSVNKLVCAVNLAQAVRAYGHLAAHLDPLGAPPPGDPLLELSTYHLEETDLEQLPADVIGVDETAVEHTALDALRALRDIYCRSTGYEYGHIRNPRERDWLRHAAEHGQFRPPAVPLNEQALLHRLSQVEVFEQFLHRFFPGRTRFSIEGVDMLVPMLDEIIHSAAGSGVCMIMVGMAHRGRLNVLAHVLAKPYAQILAEFKDPNRKYQNLDESGWLGDVKYHSGADHAVMGDEYIRTVLRLAPNPSHLEHVNPVVEGMARAAATGVSNPGAPEYFPKAALPVLIHGDASFPAQGVVSETLNFSRLNGYRTGGTIHIIANNQLGFTTPPSQGRSTLYSSDLAKGYEIPIIHVNADDPAACLEAARTAFAYREEYQKDFLIDLVGYRRFGHNEGDEPGFTQPTLYQTITNHPSIRHQVASQLIEAGEIDPDLPHHLTQSLMQDFQEILDQLVPEQEIEVPAVGDGNNRLPYDKQTSVPISRLKDLYKELHSVPAGFQLNPKIERAMLRRRNLGKDPLAARVDWATAEQLAFASILVDGTSIRLTGQDVERGTFSQRHAVFCDHNSGEGYVPLQALPQAKAAFEVHNSPLSENAALGFEYGYSIMEPTRMVIWEAQYGDFINSAQTMVDEFIASGRAKWEQSSGIVLLLPHGYEGQGPDHSSARLERFLQLSAGGNLRLANCTSAAQYFHLLRAHAASLKSHPAPLVIFAPKSLLRHPLVTSPMRDLVEGHWHPILVDRPEKIDPKQVRRLLICTGKIAIDLLEAPQHKESMDTTIARLEQIFPFPTKPLQRVIDGYPSLQEIIWVQEEPENMGAWFFIRQAFEETIQGRLPLCYVGRMTSPSPAEGSFTWHQSNQQAIIEQAFQTQSPQTKQEEMVVRG